MNIDLVLFDLDDVLVDYDHDVRCRTLGDRIGRDANTVQRALFGSGLEFEADLGRIDANGVALALSDSMDVQVTLDDCVAARAASMRARPDLHPIVETLARRCGLAILTNNGLLVRDHFPSLCPTLAPYFSGRVHCSAMYGIGKPEPEIFLRCAEALGVAPGGILFIDDKAENALGAERAGMLAHHYRDPATLLAFLTQLDLPERHVHAH
ncbi:MAG: HAD family hydrolase [Lysobacteraceae bacterium]|nr:MAG: HAD family hydrolase [Xanthomonadaceae bacterium]